MDTTTPSSSPETPPTESAAARRGWKRYLVYALAVMGVLFVALMGAVFYSSWKDAHAPIPETATIEATMTEVFGRYSDEHKGWLYVSDSKRSYVMRVVQQASIDDKRAGDGLYFIASGTPLDETPGTLYGVFHLYKDAAQNGALQREASLYEYEDVQPLTPDRVRFEALSKQQWAWVIKEVNGLEEEGSTQFITNVMLAPHDGGIKELARFTAQIKTTPAGGCAKAEADFAEWQRAIQDKNKAIPTKPAASEAEGEEDPEEEVDEVEAPSCCEDLHWTYRTDAPKEGSVTPLYITRKGLSEGQAQPDKTWKALFDTKSFEYRLPPDLQ